MCERYMRRGISLFLSVLLCFAAGLTGTAVEEDGAAGVLYDLSFDTEDPPRATLDFGRTGDQYMRGQGFVAVKGGDMTSVDVHIARMGSPSTLIAQLYACDDMGLPQGEPIAQTTLPADAVPADTAAGTWWPWDRRRPTTTTTTDGRYPATPPIPTGGRTG